MKQHKPEPSMDQQLAEFLEGWIATRVKLAEKYRLRAERWQMKSDIPLRADLRKAAHYEHEVRMLRELRARSIG